MLALPANFSLRLTGVIRAQCMQAILEHGVQLFRTGI